MKRSSIRQYLSAKKMIPGRDGKRIKLDHPILDGLKSTQPSSIISQPTVAISRVEAPAVQVEGDDVSEESEGIDQTLQNSAVVSGPILQPILLLEEAQKRTNESDQCAVISSAVLKAPTVITPTALVAASKEDQSLLQPPILQPSVEAVKSIEAAEEVVEEEIAIPQLVASKKILSKIARIPAYKRLAPLLQTRSKTALELPLSMHRLMRQFNALESVLNYLKSQDTVGILEKIRASVTKQAGFAFGREELSMIMGVYPEGYKLTPISISVGDSVVHSVAIEFPLDAVTDQFLNSLERTSKPFERGQKGGSKVLSLEERQGVMGAVTSFLKQTKSRSVTFRQLLESLVSKCHHEFLTSNNLEFTVDKIQQKWHPDFNLESVPKVKYAELPIKKQESYLDALKRQSEHFQAAKDPFTEPQTPPKTPLDTSGKPLSRAKALLERVLLKLIKVREKQRLKLANKPIADPEALKRSAILSKLRPIASSLSLHFRSNSKKTMTVQATIAHLKLAFPTYFLSDDQWYDHLKVLAEVVPTFCALDILSSCAHISLKTKDHYVLRMVGTVKQVTDAVLI